MEHKEPNVLLGCGSRGLVVWAIENDYRKTAVKKFPREFHIIVDINIMKLKKINSDNTKYIQLIEVKTLSQR